MQLASKSRLLSGDCSSNNEVMKTKENKTFLHLVLGGFECFIHADVYCRRLSLYSNKKHMPQHMTQNYYDTVTITILIKK